MVAYETSSKAMRELLSHPSLQRDNVEQTMSKLSDVLADHADIERAMVEEQALARGAVLLSAADEEALDAELAALATEENQKIHIDKETVTERGVEVIPITAMGLEGRSSAAREPVAAS
jgi:charged multivesicular body protein 7